MHYQRIDNYLYSYVKYFIIIVNIITMIFIFITSVTFIFISIIINTFARNATDLYKIQDINIKYKIQMDIRDRSIKSSDMYPHTQ